MAADPDNAGPPQSGTKKGPLEVALSIFADVKAGEGPMALLLMVNVFIILGAYYFLKSAREGLILSGGAMHIFGAEIGKAEVKSCSSAVQAVLLILVVIGYGQLARRMAPIKLIIAVTLFFASHLVLFFALDLLGVPVGIPYFIWVGIFSVTVIAQFWAFAADVYTAEQGKRLFAIVGIGGSAGAVAGSYGVDPIVTALGEKVPPLLVIAATLIILSLGLTILVHRMNRRQRAQSTATDEADAPLDKKGGFTLLLQDRYLLYVALFILILNWVNTNGEYILDREVTATLAPPGTTEDVARAAITRFKSEYFLWVNLIGVAAQLFAVSRILKYLDVRRALFILPLISLGGSLMLAVLPFLTYIRIQKTAENATDYSIMNTTKQAFWLFTTRDAKYKAKAAVDTFVVRIGDLSSALVVFVGAELLDLSTRWFVLVNLVIIVAWIAVAVGLSRENKKRADENA